MVTAAQQFAPGLLEIRPIPGQQEQAAERGYRESSIYDIQEKLRVLALKKAAVQQEIYATRNALAALISLFGPGILSEGQQTVASAIGTFSPRSKPTDLFADMVARSNQWTTVPELLERIQHSSPSSLAHFKNPGASLSNFLRTLHRRGQVELRVQDGERMWKWLGSTSGDPLRGEVI